MTTLVGTQKNFDDAVKELLELEYNSVEIYEAVINRLQNENYKNTLIKFKEDHEKHIDEITSFLETNSIEFTKGPSGKQLLLIGKVAINKIMGDDLDVIKVMAGPEEDMVKAYSRMLEYKENTSITTKIFTNALQDERTHHSWVLKTTNSK